MPRGRATPRRGVAELQLGGQPRRHAAGRASGAPSPTTSADLKAAKRDGITNETRDQWRRATAQAAPALLVPGTAAELRCSRHVVRLAAAVLVTAAAGLGVSAPAQAASCSSAHGVTVVVDFHQLGGGVQIGL